MSRTRSPKYPSYPLKVAINNVEKIYNADRTTPLPREVVAKHLGYSGLSGASDKSISAITQYGLVDRVGTGELRVSQISVDILHPESEEQRQLAINKAALNPSLFFDIWNHFENRVPSDEALRTYLHRRGFNDVAINPVIKSFGPTIAMMDNTNGTEADTNTQSVVEIEPQRGEASVIRQTAQIGDWIQWESQGVLQLPQPMKVRWISDDGEWVAVEGSETGIPISEVILQRSASSTPTNKIVPPPEVAELSPKPDLVGAPQSKSSDGFSEWFRVKVGVDKLVTINYQGEGEVGPAEINKIIKILEAQKAALED